MSDDERAMIAAIQAAPDENTARLAYADWLDENGTTDQQRARSEWIRMTCADRSKRAQQPTGQQIRRAGEPAWLRTNAVRLWPNLMSVKAKGRRRPAEVTFATGQIGFTVMLEVPRHSGPSKLEPSVVVFAAERGVATWAGVSFLRGAVVAPVVARDDPAVPVRFLDVPVRCFTRGDRHIAIHRRPFVLRGLEGVWDAIELDRADTDPSAKVLTSSNTRQPYRERADALINAALTKWARERAVGTPAQDAEPTEP